MLRSRIKQLVIFVSVVLLNLYIISKPKVTCSITETLHDDPLYFDHNIVPPYEGDYPWDFQSAVNRNFSALDFLMISIHSSWIDVLLILEVFFPVKQQRYFIEAGGADGELFGNTIYLEKFKSWKGVLIEADPYYFEELLHKKRKVYAVKVCLSISNSSYAARFQHEGVPYKQSGKIGKNLNKGNGRVLYNEKGHSGFGVDFKDFPGNERFGEILMISCYPFSKIIEKLNVTKVDVLFLDVEGQELGILKTIPFQKICVHIIVVEYDGRKDYLMDIKKFLESVGYELHDVYSSRYTIGDALFVQKGNYSKLALRNITDDEIKKILLEGTDSESQIPDIPSLKDTIID